MVVFQQKKKQVKGGGELYGGYFKILYLQMKNYFQIFEFQQKKKHVKGGGILYGGYLQILYLQIKLFAVIAVPIEKNT